jgi:hypothetical protein
LTGVFAMGALVLFAVINRLWSTKEKNNS